MTNINQPDQPTFTLATDMDAPDMAHAIVFNYLGHEPILVATFHDEEFAALVHSRLARFFIMQQDGMWFAGQTVELPEGDHNQLRAISSELSVALATLLEEVLEKLIDRVTLPPTE